MGSLPTGCFAGNHFRPELILGPYSFSAFIRDAARVDLGRKPQVASEKNLTSMFYLLIYRCIHVHVYTYTTTCIEIAVLPENSSVERPGACGHVGAASPTGCSQPVAPGWCERVRLEEKMAVGCQSMRHRLTGLCQGSQRWP